MLSLNNENINYVMTQNLKLSCVSFSYVSIRYVLAVCLTCIGSMLRHFIRECKKKKHNCNYIIQKKKRKHTPLSKYTTKKTQTNPN